MKSRTRTSSKLTPAARALLKEVVVSYREQILLTAEEITTDYGDGINNEITSRDILSAIEMQPKSSRRTSTLRSYIEEYGFIIGVIYLVVGGSIFIANSIKVSLTIEQLIGIIVALAGITISAVSYGRQVRSATLRSNLPMESNNAARFVMKWRDIEILVRENASKALGESFADKPISILVEELTRLGILNGKDRVDLKAMLRTRNSVVHKKHSITSRELELGMNSANRILGKLSRTR
ncbi:MAG TPA: hypothetical protein PKE62_03565 [Anaerolineales bacterium]|nr:hypothetical protein [Anaerolineales bacterium]